MSGRVAKKVGGKSTVKPARRVSRKNHPAISQAEFETAFNSINELVMILDSDHRIRWANKATATFLNLPVSKVAGKYCFALLHGADGPPENCPMAKMAKSGTHEESELYIERNKIWALVTASPQFDEKGNINNVVHTVTNITSSRQTEESLRESEKSYRQLADYHKKLNDISIVFAEVANTGDLFNKIAVSFRLLTGAIAATFSLFDREKQDLHVVSLSIDPTSGDKVDSVFGPGLFEMRMPVSPDVSMQMLTEVIRRPKDLYELSFGVVPRDISDAVMDTVKCREIVALALSYAGELVGTCIAYLQGDQPIVPDDALKTYAYVSGMAVIRRRIDDSLRESEAQYRLLSDHMTDTIWLMDMNLNISYQSPSVQRTRGFTPREIMDMLPEQHITPESFKGAIEVLLEEMAKVEADPAYNFSRTLELEFYRKDGTTFWSENTFTLLRDIDGKPVSILGEGRDITKRRLAEEALKESQAQYRLLAEHTTDGILLLDMNLTILYVSPNVEKIRGFTVQEAINMPLEQQITPESLKLAAELFLEELPRIEADPDYNPIRILEIEYYRKDGTTIWTESKFSIIRDHSGKPVSILGESRDITKRRKAEEALRESEEKYRLLADNTVDGVWLLDMGLNLLYCSPASSKQSGFTLEEIMGMSLEQYFTPESLKVVSEVFLREISKVQTDPNYNDVITLELEFYKKDGSAFWAETKFSIIRDEQGKPVSILGQARDISERKRMDAALRESEEKYRMVVENAKESIVIAVGGMCKFANQRTIELTGYSQEELTSRPFIEFIHPEDRQWVAERYLQVLKGMYIPNIYAFRGVSKSGDIKWVETTVVPITWEGGAAILSFIIDITGRRRMEEENQRVAKLESLGVLAGGIAHDFNNILTAIMGNIGLASVEASAGSEMHDRLEEAQKALLRARDITRQLLTFSKGGTPVKKLASLDELIKETTIFALHGSNVKCQFSIPANLWHAEVDEGQVSQVIHNLVINAEQSMPRGGTVEISGENMVLNQARSRDKGLPLKEGRYIRITVSDHGSGIPKENLSRIFDPFFSTKKSGNGLGLATSFSIARNHGGHISVESQPGSGSTFFLYLPASMELSISRKDRREQVKPAIKARILVMDDEQVVREVSGRMLNHIGYKDIEFATDGAEAIGRYKAAMESRQPFDIVILDLTIPGGIGGRETLGELLTIDPWVKAIVSSGYAEQSVMSEYLEYGFIGMVAKPYTIEELSKSIDDALH
jgi:PAS domain S-box-containing protein